MTPAEERHRPSGRPRSARNRIVAWLVALVLLALVANQLIATRVLLARVDGDLAAEIEHEHDKFRAFAARTAGAPGAEARRVEDVLDAYLRSNVPEPSEAFFSVVDGRADRRSSPEPMARLDTDRRFVAAAARARVPASGRWASAAGGVHYGVFPVQVAGDPRWGQLVVVEFAAPSRDRTVATLRTLALVSLAALLTGAVVAWLVAGRILRPVRLVRDTADRIGETDLAERIHVTGDDEVAQLARTFNRMLDRVEAAFAGQRQFLNDAGHELRTPLTIIRGHLEVMGTTDEERTRTVALVTDELARMGRIVDDLLLLAKAERPDFITPGPVDLADLTVEVAAKSQALAERRWQVAEVAERTVMADGQRLTQALMQLVSNAVEHTRPGDLVEIGSAAVVNRVLLWVEDHGSGIPPAEQERIFDRFATVAGGRRDSTGLGLAIVRSIAEGHGGTVRVSSEVGRGSRFTLDLPLLPPPGPRDPASRRGDAPRPPADSPVPSVGTP